MVMTCRARRSLAVLLCALAAPAGAAVTGKVELGALQTSGNSETSSYNTKFSLVHTRGEWENKFTGSAFFAEEEDESTAERYAAGLRSSYDFTEFNYVFVNLTYDKDLFGGVRERTTQTIGYGRKLLATKRHDLRLEAGAGARQELPQDTGPGEPERNSEAIYRGALFYEWDISDTSTFNQTLSVESGSDNTYSESVTALKLTIVGPTFASISYTVQNNSDVPAGTEETDTFLSVSLSYEFGNKE